MESDYDENEDIKWTFNEIKTNTDIGEDVNDQQKNMIYEMLLETQGAISKHESDVGKAHVTPHTIELTNRPPIWQKPRKFSNPINSEIDRQCSELLTSDIIEYSNSSWSSPVVPWSEKKTGKLGCVSITEN